MTDEKKLGKKRTINLKINKKVIIKIIQNNGNEMKT